MEKGRGKEVPILRGRKAVEEKEIVEGTKKKKGQEMKPRLCRICHKVEVPGHVEVCDSCMTKRRLEVEKEIMREIIE